MSVCMFIQKSFVLESHCDGSLYTSCAFGRICSNLLVFRILKLSTAGDGLLVKTLIMPLGKDMVISPVILTMHFDGSAPLK